MASVDTVTIIHGRDRHQVSLHGTVFDLRHRLEQLTSIPPESQILVQRGKKRPMIDIPPTTPASDLNLAGTKAMLMGGGAPVSRTMDALREVERKLDAYTLGLGEVRGAVERHTKGFLGKDMSDEALQKDERQLSVVDESCMRLLLILDEMTPPQNNADAWRAERKALVRKIQAVLNDVDTLRDDIKKWMDDKWDELKVRRGNDP